MKAWSEFIPLVAMSLPGCPRFEIEGMAKAMAIEFYQQSRAWRARDVTLVASTTLGQADYNVTNPSDTDLAGLPAVWIDGEEVPEIIGGATDDYAPGEQSSTNGVQLTSGSTVRVVPAPDASALVIKATVAYKPASTATGLSDQLFAKHSSVISSKVLQELLIQPGKPWSNANLSAYYGNKAIVDGLNASTEAGRLRRTPLRVRNSDY